MGHQVLAGPWGRPRFSGGRSRGELEGVSLKLTVVPFRVGVIGFVSACAAAQPDPGIGPTPVGLAVKTEESFYEVKGSTAEELHAAMLAAGPKIGDWPLYALNQWEVRWHLRPGPPTRSRGGRQPVECRLSGTDVNLTSRTILPRWTPPPTASDALREQWGIFLQALKVHETGHRDLGVRAAREVLRTLRAVGSTRCSILGAQADAAARRTLERYQEQNLQYDRETRFGQTQGVVWPPGRDLDNGILVPTDPRAAGAVDGSGATADIGVDGG